MKIQVDLDDPAIAPLRVWLKMLRIVRIRHEYARDRSAKQAAIRLNVSRYTMYRALASDEHRAAETLQGKAKN